MSDEVIGGQPRESASPTSASSAAPGYSPGPQYAHAAPPSGAPTVPGKRRGLMIGLFVALVLVCGLAACTAAVVGLGLYGATVEETKGTSAAKDKSASVIVVNLDKIREEAGPKLEQARTLADGKKFDAAYDLYFSVAEAAKADTETVSQALAGVALTFDEQMGRSRLSKQLDQAVVLYERFPPGQRPEAMDDLVRRYLVDPVAEEAREGKLYLEDRRKFIKAIEDKGKGEVYMTPKKDRLLTEAEVVDAQSHLGRLEVETAVVDLYKYVRPMAAAMDRFFADDSRYLGEKTVSSSDLHELGASCDALEKTLGPVQARLDKVKPGWR